MWVLTVFLSVLLVVSALSVPEKVQSGHHDHHDPRTGEATDADGERNKHRDHEAVLGSRHEADEADELSPEEAQELLEKLAHKHDKNNDGFISEQEFLDWIIHSFRSLDEEEASDRLKELDANGDGTIDWTEYVDGQYEYTMEDIEKMRASPDDSDNMSMLEMIDDDHQRFQGADVDSNGQLDLGEFVAFYHPYDYEHMHKYEIQHGIREVDLDKDGKVSLTEYLGGIEDQDTIRSEEELFKRYDHDSDGILEGDELKSWLIQDNMASAKDEVAHLIEIADVDGDGKLSIEEIRDKQEDFVSSQATDYGSTLEKMRDEL